jgi:phage terminase large subunit-like protein
MGLALTRLLKSQLRLFVFTKKFEADPQGEWGTLLKIEKDFLVGANREWDEVLDLWEDSSHRTKLVYQLMGSAMKEAREWVIEGLSGSVPDVDLIVQSFRAGVRVE